MIVRLTQLEIEAQSQIFSQQTLSYQEVFQHPNFLGRSE